MTNRFLVSRRHFGAKCSSVNEPQQHHSRSENVLGFLSTHFVPLMFCSFSSGDLFISLNDVFFDVSRKCSYVYKQCSTICPVPRAHTDLKKTVRFMFASPSLLCFPSSSGQGERSRDGDIRCLQLHFFFFHYKFLSHYSPLVARR